MKFFYLRVFNKNKMILFFIFTFIINYLSFTAYRIIDNFEMMKLQSPFTENILINTSTASFLYGIYVFIISAYVYADAFVVDKKSGLREIISTKISFPTYVRKTLIFNFLIGGVFAFLPALINILFWFFLRANVPLVYFNTMNVNPSIIFSDVFMKSPLLFTILNLMKIFFIGGSIATFSIFINTKFNNRYLGLIIPFILDIMIGIIINLVFNYYSNSFYFLLVHSIKADMGSLVILLVFILPSLVFFNKYMKTKDIL